MRPGPLLCVLALIATGAWAQVAPASSEGGDGIWINRKLFESQPAPAPAAADTKAVPATVPRGGPVIALASAVGGELSLVSSRLEVGSHLDPNRRGSLPVSGHTLDAILLRGMDRAVAARAPDSDRVFLRLNPHTLEGIEPIRRGPEALRRLLHELESWPQRQSWDRIIIAVPHFQTFGSNGMASKLHGAGLYVQDLDALAQYDVVEPDGTPAFARQGRYVALYLYVKLVVLDAKSLRELDTRVWTLDEKMYDSRSEALRMSRTFSPEVLAGRLESFVESASAAALTRTLGGRVEPGEIRQVPMPPGTASPRN
jgi:hypothetical protein